MSEDTPVRERWIYIGRETEAGKGGKLDILAVFVPALADGSTGPKKYFSQSKAIKKAPLYVGVVYTIETTNNGKTADFSTLKHEGLWSDVNQRAAWQVADRAVDTTLRLRSRQNADKGDRAMLAALKPLREIYRRTDYLTQRAIEVEVLQFLRARGDD